MKRRQKRMSESERSDALYECEQVYDQITAAIYAVEALVNSLPPRISGDPAKRFTPNWYLAKGNYDGAVEALQYELDDEEAA